MDLARFQQLVVATTLRLTDDPDDVITMTYRPGALDAAFYEWWRQPGTTVYDALERVLTRTGLTHNGLPVAPAAQALRDGGVTAQLAWTMFEHIQNDRLVGKARATS